MIRNSIFRLLRLAILSGIILIPILRAPAAAIWTNANSGLWRDSINWAVGNLPSLSGVYVTNAGSKTVTIDAATPAGNLTIGSLNIWAATNATNRVLLSDVTSRPLLVSNVTMDVRMRGVLQITNSSLVVTSVFAGAGVAFNIWAGEVTLDSGSIIARESSASTSVNVVTRVGRTNIASLNINGGFMYSSAMQVGQAGFLTSRSHGTIRMTGGLLTVPGELSVGTSLNCTGVVDMVGGRIFVPNNLTNITRIGDQGVGLMVVSNAVVSVGNVSVGRHDSSDGTLVLLAGGLVGTSDDFSIGRFGNSTGMVFLAGGQFVVTNQPIWVGREGMGKLVVSNGLVSASGIQVATELTNTASGTVLLAGGTTIASVNFTVGSATFSTGQVVITGGSLLVSNADQTAILSIPGGSLTLDAGSIAADALVLTNQTGAMSFNGGTLFTSGTIVSNGLPFVIGDGTNAAVMELRGGTHVFADGLVISPNATLTGCGTIIGNVINNGVNSINCGGPGSPPFILQHPASQQSTPGSAVNFSVVAASSSPLVYQWRHEGNALPGANADTFAIAAAQPSDAGAYDVIVSNDSGSVTSRVATLKLPEAPVITSQPVSQAVAQNSPAAFSVTAVGAAPLSYQWLLNSNVIAGATAGTFSIPSAQPANVGDYNVVVSNPIGVVTSKVATLLVLVPPTITAQPVSQSPPSNSPVTFSVAATGSPTLLYQWRYNGTTIPGATGTNFAMASAQLTNVGNYTVVVRNPVGVVTSQVATLTFPGPPVIVVQPASQTNARNTSVTFSVIASGSSPLSYRWRFNGSTISGSATNSTYTRSNLGNGDAGSYTVVITNASGSVTSQVAVLTVLTAVSIGTQPISQSVTQGVTAALRVVASGSSPFTYQWRFAPAGLAETNILGATGATLTLNNPQTNNTGSYLVVVSNPVSAITSQVATVTVLVPPGIAQQPQSLTVKPGTNITFSVTATGTSLTYQWRKGVVAIPGATGSSFTINNVQSADAGSYTVLVSNALSTASSAAAVLKVIVPPQGLTITVTGSTASISFQSVSGLNYALEYKTHLADAAWTSLAPVPGNGGTLILNDASASVAARFYRVRVE